MATDMDIFGNTKGKDINYLSRDFNSFKTNLVQYIKSYYPGSYSDFSENSTGMMFVELTAYVGDVLSYYIDYQFKEGFLQFASERKNIMTLANYLGYRPKPAVPASTNVEIMHIVPARLDNKGKNIPDMRYALNIEPGLEVRSNDNADVVFRTTQATSFAENSPDSPLTIKVFERDTSGQPVYYLLKKIAHASSGTLIRKKIQVGEASPFYEIELGEENVLEILSVTDSDGNAYYQVPYLAQSTVLIEEPNNERNSPLYSRYATSVPYILKYIKTSRRYVVHTNTDNSTTLEFGKGDDKIDDEIIIPRMSNVGRTMNENRSVMDMGYDPSNFLKTDSYGEAPANTELTIDYYIGGGATSNVASNTLNTISLVKYTETSEYLNQSERSVLEGIKNSLKVNNPEPARGGKGSESDEEIRLKGLSSFPAQLRAVTRDDYVVRAYSMPSKFGSVAKAFVTKDGILDTNSQLDVIKNNETENDVTPESINRVYGEINNPFAINMYILSYDADKKLTEPNDLVFKNLTNYISQYRMLTDGINITNAFVINIGIYFEISVLHNFNQKEVLDTCLVELTDYFEIDNWQISQPIELSSIEIMISKINGVRTVGSMRVVNLTSNDGNYSANEYDIEAATINKILYPSMDPSIFEVKFPSRDIVGRVVS
jgi:hypothetical protein